MRQVNNKDNFAYPIMLPPKQYPIQNRTRIELIQQKESKRMFESKLLKNKQKI